MGDQKSDQPIHIDSLPAARKPPEICAFWEWTCWACFIVGSILVLMAFATILMPEKVSLEDAQWSIFWVMVGSFVLAAWNTFLAAKGYGRRERALRKWIRSHLTWIAENATSHEVTSPPKDWTEVLMVRRVENTLVNTDAGPINIAAKGDFQPKPYFYAGKGGLITCSLKTYMDLIEKEVHDARVKAGRLAAALGGLLITSIQIYTRILMMMQHK